ncbi:hypothetical protein TSUD_355370 [Trifolium subterraneum]|uniref:Uncharacterized protein n=1 Tax=Trifolium subterraneum TaxID=3900 RepID=A0A2Z6M1M9_TRISU|nr:hypothetical protein TSUD_355370 [Trifolium subterraneum]
MMSVSLVLLLIVVVTIMNGYKVEAQDADLREECARVREQCLGDPGGFFCIMYCHNCPYRPPYDPLCPGVKAFHYD